MKSIRWSLLVYFLLVLALAMGAVSLLVYQQMQETVIKRERAAAELLRKQHEENVKKERDKLDEKLLSRARSLVSQASFKSRAWFRSTSQVAQLAGAIGPMPPMTAAGAAQGLLFLYQEGTHQGGPFGEALRRGNRIELQFDEEQIFTHGDSPEAEYLQVDSNLGNASWRSQSMQARLSTFPVDPSVFQSFQYESEALDRELEPGHVVRCVALKAPQAPLRGNRGPPGSPPPNSGRTEPQRSEWRVVFYVQCATETTERDQNLALLDVQLGDDLESNETESRQNLASLRNYLLLISLLAFGTAAVGGYLLIRLGLYPMHQLGEAVSRVSARDFRLPLDSAKLPVELRPVADRLTETLDLLKRAFAREKQAAADISHELRTPVASLMATAEVALRKDRSAHDYRQVIEDCHLIAQQMSRLIERLLALARLDAGAQTLRPREVDVANLAQECVEMIRPLVEEKQLRLHLERNGPAYTRTDPDTLREVLTNLLHNAIQYNRPHGEVELKVTRKNGQIELEVRDTGIGISPQAREHIFERFYRADPSRHADGMNAGLGLAIVKGYVDLLGGSIAVESIVGQGSTFRVMLEKAS